MSDEVQQQGPVRVCLTRCPLSAPEQGVHSLPCHIQHNGTAAIKSYFRPEELQPTDDAKCDAASAKRPWRAEFRGVQLDGEKVSLSAIGMQGLLLEDAGMTHESDEGRVWEVDNHFNEMTVWVMPNGGDDDAAIPSTLAQWTQLAHAIHDDA